MSSPLRTPTHDNGMARETSKCKNKQSERIRRRKKSLFKGSCELGKVGRIDVAVIVYQHGRYYVSVHTKREDWPPSIVEIVSKT
jgi:SRF-type transcription factor (DNA-binding and dimerisation domain)